MRTIPTFPEGLCSSPRDESGLWTQKYEIEVITPMFGGGVLTKQNDPITPIRIPSVLGHLRFWWRATAGRAYNTVDELRQAESALWGTLTTPGRVFGFVNEVTPTNTFSIELLSKPNGRWGYRFPLPKPQLVRCDVTVPANLRDLSRPRLRNNDAEAIVRNANRTLPAWVGSSPRFTLTLGLRTASPNDIDQVVMALRAWCNFGGIGAGTRRGFGALYCKTLAGDTDSLFLEDRTNRDWTTLQSRPLLRNELMDVTDAWHHAIQLLHEFRQGDGIGRRRGRGRSFWPEADSLRALSNQGNPDHRPGNTLPTLAHMCVVHEQALPNVGFPRAGFGLPITFQFLGDEQDSNAEATLTPAQSKRLASC